MRKAPVIGGKILSQILEGRVSRKAASIAPERDMNAMKAVLKSM